MTTLIVTDRSGRETQIDSSSPTVMEALREAGFDELEALCGGNASCATCHVYVSSYKDLLPPISEDEDDLLDGSDARTADSRLSCQLPLTPALDNIRITIAPED